MKGTIKVLLGDGRNCGFIRGENNTDYFFHASALKNIAFNELAKGDEVTFEDTDTEKGPRAEDVYA